MVFEVYQDALGHHLWRLRRKSGEQVIAVSAMAYPDDECCMETIRLVMESSSETPVIILSEPPTT